MEIRYPFFLDGATGTELQKRGYQGDVSAEQWVLEHPEAILEIQRAYVAAGSQVVYAPTFGANRQKLEEHGIFNRVEEYNTGLVALSKQAADGQAFLFQQDFFFFVCQNQYDSQCGKGKKKEGSQQISCQNQEDTDRQKEDCRNDADDLYKLSISDHICFHTIFPPPFLQTIYLRCNPCQCCQSADDQSGSADQQQNTLPCGF